MRKYNKGCEHHFSIGFIEATSKSSMCQVQKMIQKCKVGKDLPNIRSH